MLGTADFTTTKKELVNRDLSVADCSSCSANTYQLHFGNVKAGEQPVYHIVLYVPLTATMRLQNEHKEVIVLQNWSRINGGFSQNNRSQWAV